MNMEYPIMPQIFNLKSTSLTLNSLITPHYTPRFDHPDGVYVGRISGGLDTCFGNPFGHSGGLCILLKSRDDACDAFNHWLNNEMYELRQYTHPDDDLWWSDRLDALEPRRIYIINNLHRLFDRNLICWCFPARCHAYYLHTIASPYNQTRLQETIS
jgi:hypothetical protein